MLIELVRILQTITLYIKIISSARSLRLLIQLLFFLSYITSIVLLIKIYMSPLFSQQVAIILIVLVAILSRIIVSTQRLVYVVEYIRYYYATLQSLSLTITTLSLYTITVGQVLLAGMPYGTSSSRIRPFNYTTTYAQNAFVALSRLKFVTFRGLVLSPTELLIIIISFQMFYIHLVASQIYQKTSLITSYYNTLLISVRIDVIYYYTIFYST